MSRRRSEVVVFLGPSLPWADARKVLRADYRGPAAQGDVWQAMKRHPRVIVLIDGVFESQPSVWHHELRAALDAGITVFGASSMGALRAAELADFGMVGVGTIFSKYRSGEWNDDADVALLHAPGDFAFRAMTVPLVNVWHNAQRARAARVLTRTEAGHLVETARDTYYQERTWPVVLQALSRRWNPRRVSRLDAYWNEHFEDLKAVDARLALRAAAAFVNTSAPRPAVRPTQLSSLARARWLAGAAHPDRSSTEAPERRGVELLLLAELARSRGLRPAPLDVAAWRATFLQRGADVSHAQRWAEVMGLQSAAVQHHRALSSGRVLRAEARALAAAAAPK